LFAKSVVYSVPPAAPNESCEFGQQVGVDGVEQSLNPVGPTTDKAPVLGLMEAKSPLKDSVSKAPFGALARYWIVSGMGPIGEKDPVARSIVPNCPALAMT
jgi:hypothetical protein